MSKNKTDNFLNILKRLYEPVIKIDKTLDETLGKGVFGYRPKDQMNRISNLARIKVEELFYANVVKAIMDNINNLENMEEVGYAEADIKKLRRDWREILDKPEEIIGTKPKGGRLTRQEYHDFSKGVCKISNGLKKYINGVEEYIQLGACEKYMDEMVWKEP